MKSIPPPGLDPSHIMCIGQSQGYDGLWVHYGIYFDHAQERQTSQLTTAFEPTDEQRGAIAAGAPIVISLINVQRHPPIMVDVGSV